VQPHFDTWDLAPVSVSARSRLHAIQPIGIGTPLVESLSGYVIRLAASHAVRVSDLIEHELRADIRYFHAPAGIPSAVNGVGESAEHWVSTVEKFTLVDNLRLLTLLPFTSVFHTPHLMRGERAWCPRCYEASKQKGQAVYEQLLWCLQPVEVCPVHEIRLATSCPACHRNLRPVCAVSRPGVCSRCRQWLGASRPSPEPAPATDYEIWVAQQIGNLLAIAPQAEAVGRDNIRKLLTGYVELFSEGNRIAVAEAAGCTRSSFYNWCNGATTARIDLLLRMCYALKIPLTSLLPGTTAEVSGSAEAVVRTRRAASPQRTADRIRAALVAATKEDPPPSIGEVARRLGYSTPTRLYVAGSDLCKTIVRNFNKSSRNHWWRRRHNKAPDDAVIRKALEQSLCLELPVPVHRIARSLGFATEYPLTGRFPDLCRAIKMKRATTQTTRRHALESALRKALKEDPTPTLGQVATRLGYKSRCTLRAWEPRLCAQLIARRRQFAKQSKKALRMRLNAALNEDPPPSLQEVHERLGITNAISYGNFRDIHCAIAARHREFKKQLRNKGPTGVQIK
jgi:hypothetical protein